ncbi:DUF945 family protein [Deefgea chitinilytica]|uniref:DUF945 family protein n=2 Tax=Chitinibacteraceae TaxID=2897177 RepID=A0ABS2CE64_9NEIS|nr:DUF945 family protein [Deefgea chitinilytica]
MMNKIVLLALGSVVVLGGGYAGASWYAGNQISTALDNNAAALSQYPAIKVVKRDLQKSLFGAVENVTYQIGCETGVDAAHPLNGKLGTLTLQNTISHHPFNMTIDTAIQFDEKTKAELAKIFKDKQPLSIHTKLDFSGGFRTEFAVPAFMVEESGTTVTVQALNATVQSDRQFSFFDTTLKQGGLEVVTKAQKSKFATGALDYESKLKKSSEGLYVGKDQVKLASLVLADSTQEKPVDFRLGLSQVSGESAIEGGLMRGVVKGQMDDVQVNQQKVGTLTLEAGLERLDAGAMKAFNEAFGVQAMLQCKGSNPAEQMKILEAQAEALLAKDPKYSQKMSLKTGEGESVLAFHLQTKGLTKNDFANPDTLTKKLDAAVSMQVPKSLVERLIKDLSPADAVENTLASFQEGLGMGVQQGFVVTDGKLIKANFIAQQGNITLNGKPFDPMQLMGAH